MKYWLGLLDSFYNSVKTSINEIMLTCLTYPFSVKTVLVPIRLTWTGFKPRYNFEKLICGLTQCLTISNYEPGLNQINWLEFCYV